LLIVITFITNGRNTRTPPRHLQPGQCSALRFKPGSVRILPWYYLAKSVWLVPARDVRRHCAHSRPVSHPYDLSKSAEELNRGHRLICVRWLL